MTPTIIIHIAIGLGLLNIGTIIVLIYMYVGFSRRIDRVRHFISNTAQDLYSLQSFNRINGEAIGIHADALRSHKKNINHILDCLEKISVILGTLTNTPVELPVFEKDNEDD